VEIINLSTTENGAVVEFVGRGTHTGSLRTPVIDIPPIGRPFELRFCDVYKVKHGKIVRHSTYYDALGLLQQLGVIAQGSNNR
jgi:ketosteroid isomerase-like protein